MATIDDETITREELRERLKSYDGQILPSDTGDAKTQTQLASNRAALDQLINERLLLMEARNRGLLSDTDRADPKKCREAVRKVLVKLGEQVYFPSYQESLNYYNNHRQQFSSKTRYQLEHLFLKSESRAWKLKNKLEKGELDLAEARRQTTGTRTADNESQRLITVDEMPIEVAAILPDLELNQVSPPVATPYGYHLIIVRKIVPAGIIPFAEVENKIKDLLFTERLKQNYQNWLELSRKQHTIKIYNKHLSDL